MLRPCRHVLLTRAASQLSVLAYATVMPHCNSGHMYICMSDAKPTAGGSGVAAAGSGQGCCATVQRGHQGQQVRRCLFAVLLASDAQQCMQGWASGVTRSHSGFGASLCRPHRALELAHGMQLTHFVGMVLKLASHAVSRRTAQLSAGLSTNEECPCLLLCLRESTSCGGSGVTSGAVGCCRATGGWRSSWQCC